MEGTSKHEQQIGRLLGHLAEAASQDNSIAESVLRNEGLDPEESVNEVMACLKRTVAQAKTENEETSRGTLRKRARQEAERLCQEFGSAVDALRRDLKGSGDVALRFRKLEDKASEDDAFEMLVEKIELDISDEEDSSQ